jgi:small subunit ribosomal protein S9
MADIKINTSAAGITTRSGVNPSQPAKKGPDKGGFYWGTGRRKSSVARVRIKPGTGKLLINKRELSDYFTREQDKKAVMAPLQAVEGEKSFDVFVNVRGGGTSGQAGATLLGIARALRNYDENYIQQLRDDGYLTRDSRMVERKKPGQSGARKRFQFSKR